MSVANCIDVWEQELREDSDRHCILDGVHNGFRVVEPGSNVSGVETKNHRSALLHKDAVEKELRSKIVQGNFVNSRNPALL
jgi:hypothetical protein